VWLTWILSRLRVFSGVNCQAPKVLLKALNPTKNIHNLVFVGFVWFTWILSKIGFFIGVG
jgi:hypothetical protein